MNNRLIKSNDAGGGACTNTVDLYNPFPDGGGVALYQLNGDATDVSGNYDGTATNVTYGAGQFGQAGVFNGSSSRITSNVGVSVNHSISMWIKFNSIPAAQKEFLDWFDSSTGRGLRLNTYNSNQIRFSSGTEFYYNGVTTGVWYHLAYSNGNCFVNGSLVATITELTSTADNGLYIGSNHDVTRFSDCEIDQVRFFSRALRPYEVEALYTEEYCTPTIVPSEHFNTITYSGDGQARSFTGVGFQPDLVWFKNRNDSFFWHTLWDSVRGPAKDISSNVTDAENTNSSRGYLTSFDPDGMSVVPGSTDIGNMNAIGNDVVAWNFKAGGAAVTNTDGTITSQVSANTEAGFSVVSWDISVTQEEGIGHGLGQKPSIVILKDRSESEDWFVYTDIIDGSMDYLHLNLTEAKSNSGRTLFNSDVFYWDSLGSYIAYCFAEVEGFSNFGSYVGTGAAGNTIVTGFEPAFVIAKMTSAADSWRMYDNKRIGSEGNGVLYPNSSTSEGNVNHITFLENGFVWNSDNCNSINQDFIYMAFAADPTAVEPSLEDSFNTVTYTGNGGTQTIGGVFEGGGSFNGSSSKITLPNGVGGTGAFSVSVWINSSDITTAEGIWSIGLASGSNIYAESYIVNGLMDFRVRTVTNVYFSAVTTLGDISVNTWHNIVYVFPNTTATDGCKVYIDGEEKVTATSTTGSLIRNNTNCGLGSRFTTGTQTIPFNGSIDQVRIFNTALTAAQVTELYEETDADSHTLNFPSGAGAVALYELNGNANDTGGTYNGTATSVTWLNNGVGFQPDLVWIKSRSATYNNVLVDSVRGSQGLYKRLYSNTTNAENSSSFDTVTSIDSNGFTVNSVGVGSYVNDSGQTYVAWNWKGAEIPAINSNGSITSVVSANPAAGFSIVSYTGTGSLATVGHGLSAKPEFIIAKNLDTYSGDTGWLVYNKTITANNKLYLNATDASASTGNWGNTEPTSSVFYIEADGTNASGKNYIAYCFAEVAEFSKFGSYTGTGAAGNFQDCGFEPAFVMIKITNITSSWFIWDNKRSPSNPRINILEADDSAAAYNSAGPNFLPTGFDFDSDSYNNSGLNFIYMAFANQF